MNLYNVVDAKASNVVGVDCTGSDNVCLGNAVGNNLYFNFIGQCVNSKFVKLSDCAGGLSCHVLPLVNKPGTSVSCDTEADKQARFAAAGVVAPVLPPNNAVTVGSSSISAEASTESTSASSVESTNASSNKAGDFICIDDTQFRHFVSADK